MKTAIAAVAAGVVASVLSTSAFAFDAQGTIPPGRRMVTIPLARPGLVGDWSFTFLAPPVNAGVHYALTYCVGPRTNPCNSRSSRTFDVLEGQAQHAVIPQNVFRRYVLVVGQGTKVPVPYHVIYF